jgi:vacuolar-type H+-ATPase subunit H
MKPLRWALGGLVWLVAGLLGAVGLLLSVTIILLPLGIPVLMLSRRLFSLAGVLVLPRHLRHPVQEARKETRKKGNEARKEARKKGSEARKQARKKGNDALERTKSLLPGRKQSRRARLQKQAKKRMSSARDRLIPS